MGVCVRVCVLIYAVFGLTVHLSICLINMQHVKRQSVKLMLMMLIEPPEAV